MIDEMISEIREITSYYGDCTKYGNKNAEQQTKSYGTTLNYEVADLIEEIIGIAEKYKSHEQKWISVEKALPEKNGYYLVVLDFGKYKPTTISQYEDGDFYNKDYYPSKHTKVIAWMPIPEYKEGR